MNTFNARWNDSTPADPELGGLFCEEVLRGWLENLEQMVDQNHRAEDVYAGESDGLDEMKSPVLKVIQN